jgi:Plant mobile domain
MNNLLYLQQGHRAQQVLTGNLPAPLLTPSYINGLPWDERYKRYVAMSGLDCVRKIGPIPIDNALISALVERWRQETHTFHMPVGELTITLEDVAVLFGLRVDGDALCLRTRHDWPAVVEALLGHVDARTFRNRSRTLISVSWLRNNFSHCPKDADESTVQQYARAYLLMLVGTILFRDHSGDGISPIYLPLFVDFQEAGHYSWGSAVLAYLYRELCAATNPNRMVICGAMMLLQIWSWERFPLGRPNYQPERSNAPLIGGEDVNEGPPLGYFWSQYHHFSDHQNTATALALYRLEIDCLHESEVNWQPYEGRMNFLPAICSGTPELWRTTAPLIHFWIVEMHNPHRVLRQFGRYQHIAPFPRSTSIELHGIKNRMRDDWKIEHATYLWHWDHRWNCCFLDERPYDPSIRDAYMQWFSQVSILYLSVPPGVPALP